MAEDERAADRHATWVGLRTLRQRPTVVGRMPNGEPVYEVRSVKLLMPSGAAHFKRLVQCAKCQRDVPGAPVFAPEDLERPANPVFCGQCAREAPKGAASSAPALVPEVPAAEPRSPDPGPIAAIEARLAEVTRQLNSRPVVDPQVAALAETVAELQRELRHVASAASGVAALLDAQRREHDAVVAEADRKRGAEISALAKQTRDQAAAIAGLVESQGRLSSLPTDPQVTALAEAVDELRGRVDKVAVSKTDAGEDQATMLDTQRQEFFASLAEVRRDQRAEISVLEQDMRDEAKVTGALIAAQRDEMEKALEEVVQRTLDAVARPIEELKEGQQALEERLSTNLEKLRAETLAQLAEKLDERSADDLASAAEGRFAEVQATVAAEVAVLAEAVRQVQSEAAREALDAVSDPLRDLTRARQSTESRLDALTAALDAGASRQHLLEQKLNQCNQRLSLLLEASAELEPNTRGRAPGAILEGLERQLRAAEERLAQR